MILGRQQLRVGWGAFKWVLVLMKGREWGVTRGDLWWGMRRARRATQRGRRRRPAGRYSREFFLHVPGRCRSRCLVQDLCLFLPAWWCKRGQKRGGDP